MLSKVLYVTSTHAEAEALKKVKDIEHKPGSYRYGNMDVNVLVTGVGSVSTIWSVKEWISVNGKPDLVINGGIAGSYKEEFGIGEVVLPASDRFADSGIEDGDTFLTLPESGLSRPDEFPFSDGYLPAYSDLIVKFHSFLRQVNAITVNTATGSENTRNRLLKKFNPDIETMEGAAFFYICIRENIPFLALRAISNMVEPRDKSKWDIAAALDNLSEKLGEVLLRLD
jgi:futalosine hydrolase